MLTLLHACTGKAEAGYRAAQVTLLSPHEPTGSMAHAAKLGNDDSGSDQTVSRRNGAQEQQHPAGTCACM